MYLKEITLTGFKSFAKKSELSFQTPITAIVGPNGSGKSNVAEAFRFVLGEQSVKSLRGKRGEDLIWGGSDSVTRGNRASVAVRFDNAGRQIGIDFDEVTIERVVHRDGQNEYKINGSSVRLKDVHELLASAHIGATGHHIISQGQADRVISAGAKERREMIEDALGLKVYQIKKQEAAKKLEKTVANIAHTESLRREAAPHLKYLKKQVERAERSLQTQSELAGLYAHYLKREDVYLALRCEQLVSTQRPLEQEIAQLQRRVTDLKEQIDQARTTHDTSELDAAVQAHRTAQQAAAEAGRKLSTIEGQIQLLQRRIERAEQATPAVDELLPRSAFEKVVTSVTTQIEKVLPHNDAKVLTSALTAVAAELREFLDQEKVVAPLDTTQTDRDELQTLQQTMQAATTAAAEAAQAEEQASAQVTAARKQQEQQTADTQSAERELFAVLNQQREQQQRLVEIETELTVIDRDRQDFKQELQEAVTLLGRDAMSYSSHELTQPDGRSATNEDVLGETREKQRDRRRQIEKLKIRLEELGVGATDELLKEYADAQKRDEFLKNELSDLSSSVTNLQSLIAEMDEQLHEQFVSGIEKISLEFNRFFTLMFGGGTATLERVQVKTRGQEEGETAVASEGVDLSVALPNKRVKGLDMLSGGERALTSIALIFAMSQVNPPPFIILDETDAALDEANSRRYGDMIEALAERSQLILITHNRETMARAGVLYGITMAGDGVSKVLSVKFDEAASHAK